MASTAAIPVFTVLAVFSQEVSRYGSYRLMKLAQPSFEYLKESEKSSVNDIKGIAVSVGGGFAFAAGCFTILNVMFLSLGPGIPGIDGKNAWKSNVSSIPSNLCSGLIKLLLDAYSLSHMRRTQQ